MDNIDIVQTAYRKILDAIDEEILDSEMMYKAFQDSGLNINAIEAEGGYKRLLALKQKLEYIKIN